MFGRTIDNELASKLTRFYTLLSTEASTPRPTVPIKKDGNTAAHDRFLLSVKQNRSFSGNDAYFRSIAKICLNYYLSKGYPRQYCDAIKAYIRGESRKPAIHYYTPENGVVHSLADNEVSHILHLHGNSKTGILYAYIELFNMQNLVIVFSMDYDGKDIEVTYCRDLISNEEISKKIELRLTREQLEKLPGSPQSMEDRLFPRFERILHLIQRD